MSDNFVKDFLTADTHGIPNFVWGLIAVAGLGIGFWFKNRASSSNQSTGIDTSTQTATGVGPVYTSGPGTVPLQPTTQTLTVRQQGLYSWDKTHSGAPVRASASGAAFVLYYAPWGSQIIATGPQVTGSSNLVSGGGSNLWYPVGGGYISVQDAS